jgi:hypothetical protein
VADADDPGEDGEDDDCEALDPPSAARVAARCGVLVALSYRAWLETADAFDERADSHARLVALAEPALAAEVDPAERDRIARPLGGFAPQESIDLSWLVEGAAVLAWALGLHEPPPADESATGDETADGIEFLARPWTFPTRAERRDEEEIEDRFAAALAYHWRMREHRLHGKPVAFEAYVDSCDWARLSTTGLDVDGDLRLRGTPVSRAPRAVVEECTGLAAERHRAFEWLVGSARLWSDVSAGT